MKFGVLGFSYAGFRQFASWREERGFYSVNLGDSAQTIASRELYRSLGVAEQDIVVIDRDTLPTYAGEPAVLIMNGIFSEQSFPIPASVTPLFIGFAASATVVRQQRELLQRHAPIGCRDVATTNILRESGIEAYVSGCVTMTFQPRPAKPRAERLLIVHGTRAGELPSAVFKHIPGRLLDSAVFIDHRLPVGEFPVSRETSAWIERYEAHLLKRYRDEATLVLTPLLHVASPCLSMGVPVVIARKDEDSRFSLIRNLLPLYTPDRFGEIDWAPEAPGSAEVARSYTARLSELLWKAGVLLPAPAAGPERATMPAWRERLAAWEQEFADSGQCEAMRQFLFRQSARPANLSTQKFLFARIAENGALPLHFRLNAMAALAWKRLETGNEPQIEASLRQVTAALPEAVALAYDADPRADRNHVTLSLMTAQWHLLLYTGRFDRLANALMALQDHVEGVMRKPASPALYHTASNMVRGLAVLAGRHLAKGRNGHALRTIQLSTQLLREALRTGYHEGLKHFTEYAGAVAIVQALVSLHREQRAQGDEGWPQELASRIGRLAIRIPDPRLEANIEGFYRKD